MALEIIIIDDDKVFVWLQEKLVKKSQLHAAPHCFLNAKDALNFIDDNLSPNSQYLILLDINMPIMNGWDFLDSIQQKPYTSQIDIIMLSSSIESSDKERARNYSLVKEYLEKPLTLELCKKLKQTL
ncbi:response regulator [Owenweeksia hongkongensis]|uniref:response regulator n=1 Tax=Owenweeksia hongkongensis TaxID=253245 RepID=UPI003A948584